MLNKGLLAFIFASIIIASGSFIFSEFKFNNLGNKPAQQERGSYNDTSRTNTHRPRNVYVKYRGTVDIGHPRFSYLDTDSSSFVRGAWYDSENNYMVIKLNETYYHYCGFGTSEWINFSKASSFGVYYNSRIKGNYDCRTFHAPDY